MFGAVFIARVQADDGRGVTAVRVRSAPTPAHNRVMSTPEADPTPERPAGPSLTVAAVARRLGVAPATLRTWDRRYGLGPSEHLAGSHRRYSSHDVARLLVMRRLTLEGVAPSEAARSALASADVDGSHVPTPTAVEAMDAFGEAVPMAADPRGLASAAVHFDNAAVRWMLARVHPRDTLAWWADLVEPALRHVVERTALERPGESAGPTLTAAAFAELRSRAALAVAHLGGRREMPIVLIVPAADITELRAHVVAAALQAHGVRARVLSSSAPGVVADVVGRIDPAAILLETAGGEGGISVAHVVRAVVAVRPSLPIFVHHVAAASTDLPVAANIHRVRTLTGALHEILAAV